MQTDDELMASYRSGQTEAFEQLYRRHAPGLFTYLRMQVGDAAEDLLQDLFSRVSLSLSRYRAEGRFAAWLYTIARNLVRDRLRRPLREIPLDDNLTDCCSDERYANRLAVRDALCGLPTEQREVVLLRIYGGLSFPEIGRVLGCPPNTAITRMHRALGRLRRVLVTEEVSRV